MNTEKPKLPSIHLMLQGMGVEGSQHVRYYPQPPRLSVGHRRHISELPSTNPNCLPIHMQNLSISKPATIEPSLNNNNDSNANNRLTTGSRNDSTTNNNSPPTPATATLASPPRLLHQFLHHQQQQNQRFTPRNMHSRSFSEYSHPYHHHLHRSPPALIVEGESQQQQGYHRRAISTNTLDLILQPIQQQQQQLHEIFPPPLMASTSTTTSTHSAPYSPTLSASSSIGNEPSEQSLSDSDKKLKYQCPYCDKSFSRPSSLRIHTYSHTGEKPFMCPEPGCSRKFSVQSNMRRHLRIHRLGRTVKRPAASSGSKMTGPSQEWVGQEHHRQQDMSPVALRDYRS